MCKHHGLTGKTVLVRRRTLQATKEDPWAKARQPMRILAEYPRFLLALVLPVYAPEYGRMSRTYSTCLSKADIYCGEVILEV